MRLAPVFVSSGDLTADRRYELARELAARGDLPAAADLFGQALELAPGFAAAWFELGDAREKSGDREGALAAFQKAVAADPGDRLGAALRLARLGVGEAVMSRGYVRTLFDQYALSFDRALTQGLSYRAPELLLAAVETACRERGRAMRFGSMLDLGCGTGLAGAAFRPHIDWLIGVDLSPGMVAEARNKGLYDRLAVGDLMEFLAAEAQSHARHHLIVAADVFTYLPDLGSVAAAVAGVLAPEGAFAFTVETHDKPGVILRETLRYAHGEDHVRAALAGAGLQILALAPGSTRTEKGEAVPGLIAVAAL
jgi:predicted TPR repeat methyltransferase